MRDDACCLLRGRADAARHALFMMCGRATRAKQPRTGNGDSATGCMSRVTNCGHAPAAAPAAALRAALQAALCAGQFASWQSLLQNTMPLHAPQRLNCATCTSRALQCAQERRPIASLSASAFAFACLQMRSDSCESFFTPCQRFGVCENTAGLQAVLRGPQRISMHATGAFHLQGDAHVNQQIRFESKATLQLRTRHAHQVERRHRAAEDLLRLRYLYGSNTVSGLRPRRSLQSPSHAALRYAS